MKKLIDIMFGWWSTLLLLLILLAVLTSKDVAGRIEGVFFPVTTVAQLSLIENQDSTSSFIWGSTEKLRSCEFQKIEWRLGDLENSIIVGVSFDETSKVRPEGSFSFGPWRVQLTEHQIKTRSFAKVYHKCHILWPTQTHFYPDKE